MPQNGSNYHRLLLLWSDLTFMGCRKFSSVAWMAPRNGDETSVLCDCSEALVFFYLYLSECEWNRKNCEQVNLLKKSWANSVFKWCSICWYSWLLLYGDDQEDLSGVTNYRLWVHERMKGGSSGGGVPISKWNMERDAHWSDGGNNVITKTVPSW